MAERNAEILVWGQIEPAGRNIELRFLTVASSPGERQGRCTPHNLLFLPVEFSTD